ncbi:hypothetical protein SAMN05660649_01215 [Desulfotomaculum arcticum]|uniref:Uncharacterized protein n=1 Tax=Desulfotruncus arcticus DSM 17038 TaxID=1121424 RepID=A0A1I2QLD5_9FIRM|nr:hypothetical protein SAMN05660649_01215 [Desulfotomaculum arcticum] [Desulfotruncus arcticus DSM 17038]
MGNTPPFRVIALGLEACSQYIRIRLNGVYVKEEAGFCGWQNLLLLLKMLRWK